MIQIQPRDPLRIERQIEQETTTFNKIVKIVVSILTVLGSYVFLHPIPATILSGLTLYLLYGNGGNNIQRIVRAIPFNFTPLRVPVGSQERTPPRVIYRPPTIEPRPIQIRPVRGSQRVAVGRDHSRESQGRLPVPNPSSISQRVVVGEGHDISRVVQTRPDSTGRRSQRVPIETSTQQRAARSQDRLPVPNPSSISQRVAVGEGQDVLREQRSGTSNRNQRVSVGQSRT